MGNFNRDRGQGGGRSFGGGDRYNNGRSDRPQMYPATCSNCGNACEVPFKPTGSKPVLCNNCFRASGGPDRRDDRPRFDKPRFEKRHEDRFFDNTQGRPTQAATPQYKEQFESLNYKLDKILNILKAASEPEVPKKTKEEIISVTAEMPVEKKKTPKKKAEKKEKPVVEKPTV